MYLPYEWFDSVDKLEETFLPDCGAFYSSFVLEERQHPGCRTCGLGEGRRSLSGTQVWPGKLRRVAPDLDRPRHDHLQGLPGVLQQPGCRPLVTAVTRIQEFYKENRLDIFRVAITAPGMAHKTVKTGICGGPSIIFKQHHKVGETHLRSNPSQGVGVSPDTMPTHCICGRSANLC